MDLQIQFIFSFPYQNSLSNKKVPFPEVEMSDMIEYWTMYRTDIITALKDITGLSFKSEKMKCYLNTEFSVSDPLSLRIEDIGDMKDNLVHELIHVLLGENYEEIKDKWIELNETFKSELPVTRTHIAIHRIHRLVYNRLFPERIKNIMNYSEKDAYIRSWVLARTHAEVVDNILGLHS